jgi:hypothetical protein
LLFRDSEKTTLRLVATKTLPNGVVVLTYEPDQRWRNGGSDEGHRHP